MRRQRRADRREGSTWTCLGMSGQDVLQALNERAALVPRADADAQVLRDAWLLEMPHQHRTLAQQGGQFGRIVLRVAREHEVGLRRQHLEAQVLELQAQAFARVDDLVACLAEPRLVVERGHGASGRQPVDRVRIEAVLDPHQRVDEVRLPAGETDAQAGQRARLGQRLHHEQVRIPTDQRQRTLAAEIDIRLVDQHDAIRARRKQLFDARQRLADAGRRVRVGDDDAAAALAGAHRERIDVDAQAVIDRQLLAGDAVELGIDPVEAVAHVWHQQRLRLLEEGEERVREHLVRAVAREHFAHLQAVAARHGFAQRERCGVGVAFEAVGGRALDRRDGVRRRRVRVLVGVELDEVGDARLLAGHVGLERADARAPEGRCGRGGHGVSRASARA
eukprot:Opistho-1_new@8200